MYENLANGIPIIPFHGEKDDTELLKLLVFLKEIKSEKNYIPILDKLFKLKYYREATSFNMFMKNFIKE